MRCIIHEVRRNSGSISTNFEENTAHFSQLEVIRLIQSIPGETWLLDDNRQAKPASYHH